MEREAETQAEGEAGSMQGARRGTRSQDPRITTCTKGRHSTTGYPGAPEYEFLLSSILNLCKWLFWKLMRNFTFAPINFTTVICPFTLACQDLLRF